MRKAAWLLPNFLEGSGGHRTILQNAQYLTERGFICDVYVEDNGEVRTDSEIAKQVEKYFGESSCHFILGYNVKSDYDIVFATAWYTAKIVRDLDTKAKKVYFVQDFEALFNPMGDGYLLASNSYCYGLHPITIGRWLTQKMQEEYNTASQYFDFCYDKEVYRPLNLPRENAICFIYQPDKPRRCHIIGTEALGIVKHLRPDIKIYLYGSREKGHIWFEHHNLGIISIDDCNALYNRCRVGFCISSSNPSRIPFEMMATGLPVVDLHMENNLYDIPEGGALLAYPTPESIAEAIIRIYDNAALQQSMSQNGIRFMEGKTLEYGYAQFFHAVDMILTQPDIQPSYIEKIYFQLPIQGDNSSLHIKQKTLPYAGEHKGFISRLKQNPVLRKSKLLRRFWRWMKRIFS